MELTEYTTHSHKKIADLDDEINKTNESIR